MLQNAAEIWEIIFVVRTVFFIVIGFLLFLTEGNAAETNVVQPKGGGVPPVVEVTLRFSKNEGFSRLVFETKDESFIKNTVVTSSQNQIKIQFPSNPEIKAKGNPDGETSFKGRIYLIRPAVPFTVKVLKLSSPPRLSLDIIKTAKEESSKPAGEGGPSAEIPPILRIVLDPGHGGYDLGIISGDFREKDIVLSISRDIERALRSRAVFLTRKSDQSMSITDRALFTAQKSPDIFISLHLSLAGNFVIYTSFSEPANSDQSPADLYRLASGQKRFVEKSRALAERLGKAIKDEFKTDIIYRDMSLPLLNSVAAPAVLIELPGSIVYDKALRARLSGAIVKGIWSYAGR